MQAEQIVGRLKALRDARMRAKALVGLLEHGDPAACVEALAEILNRARTDAEPDFLEALECITHAAADPALSYTARQALYTAAVAAEHGPIARLFLTMSPHVDIPPALQKQLGPERALRPADRPLTLGERKALARTHRRDKLLLLIRDPHPDVVAILLDNPHVTEADIVRVAAARPAVPASLALIAAHPRWNVRHPVKRALVLNPATPLADAIRLATTLRGNDLTELASDPSVPTALRRHAADLLLTENLS